MLITLGYIIQNNHIFLASFKYNKARCANTTGNNHYRFNTLENELRFSCFTPASCVKSANKLGRELNLNFTYKSRRK
ncbi:hypothetical protein l11_02830 [Neisseria weaveri LMG 5135]|nr:hypothetical protein l11_02830 [Neisseria weaveri LMG 5135]